jgi:hypothetical protein
VGRAALRSRKFSLPSVPTTRAEAKRLVEVKTKERRVLKLIGPFRCRTGAIAFL